MTTVQNTDLRSVDSGTIWLPPNATIGNLAIPSLHLAGTPQLYDVGTKFTYNDKVFKYCKANTGGTLYCHVGAANQSAIAIARALVAEDADAGDTVIYIEQAAASEDDYKYGHVYLAASGSVDAQNRGIIASAETNSDGDVAMTLDFPLERSIAAASDYATVYSCIYSSVAQPNDQFFGVVCLPCLQIATTALEYFWGQTWGIAYVGVGASGYGAGSGERTMCFDGNGYIQDQKAMLDAGYSLQIAGYQIVNTYDTREDVNCIMLQISP